MYLSSILRKILDVLDLISESVFWNVNYHLAYFQLYNAALCGKFEAQRKICPTAASC